MLWTAAQHRSRHSGGPRAGGNHRIELGPPPAVPESDAESFDVWGFDDTRFRVNSRGDVEISGSRYELSGKTLPSL